MTGLITDSTVTGKCREFMLPRPRFRAGPSSYPGQVAMPKPGSATDRGYGVAHQKQRRAWEPKVRRGEARCARCREPITLDQAWDLGHSDDRTVWTGPEHATCNRRAGQAAGNAARKGLKHSRVW